MKRIAPLIGTNHAVLVALGVICTLTVAHQYFTSSGGLDLGRLGWMALFSTRPPLEARLAALEAARTAGASQWN